MLLVMQLHVVDNSKKIYRRNRMKSIKMILMVTVAVFITGSLIGEDEAEKKERRGPRGGQHKGMGERRERLRKGRGDMLKDLGLSEEQQAKMKELREVNGENMKKLAEAAKEAHKALKEASMKDEIDEEGIRALARNAGDAMGEMTILKAKMKKEFEALLTDEQKAKLDEKKTEMKERMEKMKEKCKQGKEKEKGKGCSSRCDKKKENK